MNDLQTVAIQCPYCGERLELVIDCSYALQEYIEDCQVCCKPININVKLDKKNMPIVQASGDE